MRRFASGVARLIPDLGDISAVERLRASFGAFLGLLVTGLVTRVALGSSGNLPLLIAPMGASAVLLFAVPSSPLAQPWSILGGNVVSALIGVTAARVIPDPIAAAAIGGGLAIAGMLVLRCLHPPSGAVALTAVLGGPAIAAAGYSFVIWPVGLNSILLLVIALAFNNATGRRYPHRPAKSRLVSDDIAVAQVLRRHDELVDVGRHDLALLVREVGAEAHGVSSATGTCSELMRPETEAVVASSSLDDVLDRMERVGRTSLPVVDTEGHCLGIVFQAQIVQYLRPTRGKRRIAHLFRRSMQHNLAPAIIDSLVQPLRVAAAPDTSLTAVVAAMVGTESTYTPVLDQDRKIVGTMTQSDLLAWMASDQRFDRLDRETPVQPRSAIQRL